MKAICVTETRQLEVREVPTPAFPPSGHILVDIVASAINHGDKAFLSRPTITTGLKTSLYEIWGASSSGKVRAIGNDVPAEFAGRNVALYRSLTPSPHIVGLWSEQAVVPYTSALILPECVAVEDYSGSLVNAMTGYAFVEEMLSEGHKGLIVTAGASATGLAITAIARRKHIPLLALVRSEQAGEELRRFGVEHVLVTESNDFESQFATLAEQLGTTAVFDGIGGELINRIAPHLPVNSTVSFYGFLGGASPISVPSVLFVARKLTMKGFSNFNSRTVKDTQKLRAALTSLADIIADPMFRTRPGKKFSLDQITEAMAYETRPGAKAILTPAA
ncbi:zinc-binding dehydrogenase [Gluconacetobacter tumulicola]|uniref:Zinc-binding dehydrogenase n=1 Tax=Gluconacetobacter tumulicola TaxID=1017177 RepID=A0A7W4P815_9PROT|nr:zinc-binding dehydrogenase [Gluconacetobacter tumulicola]MBB2180539.1 zinc-binding dehydrogenase [Gluconacetobacter tumulicola]